MNIPQRPNVVPNKGGPYQECTRGGSRQREMGKGWCVGGREKGEMPELRKRSTSGHKAGGWAI